MILDSRPTLTRAEARTVYDGFAVKGHAGGRDATSGYGGPAVQALLAMAAFADARSVSMVKFPLGSVLARLTSRAPSGRACWRLSIWTAQHSDAEASPLSRRLKAADVTAFDHSGAWWTMAAVSHAGLEPRTSRQGPRQICRSHVWASPRLEQGKAS